MKEKIKRILRHFHLLNPVRLIFQRLGLVQDHGHQLLLKQLRIDQKHFDSDFHGRILVEIGSTREDLPGQGSTAILAQFSADHGLHFRTVDMDPDNTERARQTLAKFQSGFEAINAKGEDFLRESAELIDYCYLDAFDIDHGTHSEARKRRYEEHLGVSISNELCSTMHLACAQSLTKVLSIGGIVVFDDCWSDNGKWSGKGELGVPFLLENGFALIDVASNAVALRRDR